MDADSARDFGEMFGSLQTLLLSVEDIDDFLQEVSELAATTVSPAVSCGIMVEYDGHPLTVASSDARARRLDETQYDAHEGPCLHALRSGEVVDVPETAEEDRWPTYVRLAREHGLRSSLSLPLLVQGEPIGAMNLYSSEETHHFDGMTRVRAELFAAQASTALFLALRQAKQSRTLEQLETALGSRSVIDQAMGILMGQQQCDAETAFVLLRTHSQHNNRKLRDVARELVARTSGGAEA